MLPQQRGFDRIELFRTFSESSPVHADTSVRMVRERLDNAGVTLTGLNIRNITGRNSSKDERDLSYNMAPGRMGYPSLACPAVTVCQSQRR